MPDATLLSRLHDIWAYVSLGASSIIVAEASPMIGGFAAYEGHMGLVQVGAACAIATWLAGIGFYFLGRHRGKWIRTRWRKVGRLMAGALWYVRRRPWRAALLVRFAYGARYALPLACGAARVPLSTYLIGSAISSIVWVIPFTLLGWVFGETAVLVLGRIRKYEDWLAALIVVAIAAAFYVLNRQGLLERVVRRRIVDPDAESEDSTGGSPKIPRPGA
ncbi:MAG: DedA family protein [Gemmatimonadaceae bacterium]